MEERRNSPKKNVVVQFIKFALVGVANTLVDFLVFQLLNLLLGWVYVAQVVGYAAGVANSYILNSRWTFGGLHRRSAKSILLFLVVNLVSLGVSLLVIWLCREKLGITNDWAAGWVPQAVAGFITGDTVCKLIAIPCSIMVNFIGNKLLVFHDRGRAA